MTRKGKTIDNYHGFEIADPFRWLEDARSSEVQEWTALQDASAREFLAGIPQREELRQRLEELWRYTRYSAPAKHAGSYFFQKAEGLQNQPVLYRTDDLESEPEVALDPNELSDDGTVALTSFSVSKDGRYLAYACSNSGSDWQDIMVRDLATGQDLDDHVRFGKFNMLPWRPDSSGFFYTRYPEPGTVPPEDVANYNKVFFHRVGTSQADDELIYERPDAKEQLFRPTVTEDGRYLVITIAVGTLPKNRVYFCELTELDGPGEFTKLLDENDAEYVFVGNEGDVFYFQTDNGADRGRIVGIDLNEPEPEHWREIVGEAEDVIASCTYAGGRFAVVYNHDAYSRIKVFSRDGTFEGDIDLPTMGSIWTMSGKPGETELFFDFTSFLHPLTVFSYDLATQQLKVLWEPEVDFDPEDYVTRQVFYSSKDGTRVPMFISHKRGLELDGENPTLLYGYGGFNISSSPRFGVNTLVWMERGGVYAVACMRGGGEYGTEWHEAGMLENKQNVFDDFIAAGEWLVQNSYTDTRRLAIMGGSNGGLLVAACMLQRPDLYGAVVCRVPVIDMLRYHKYTIGRFWTGEYGNAETDAEHFRFMYAYSPLHNIRFGAVYPPVLIMTADSDNRVAPAHAKKFTATLQEVAVSDNPILLRVESKAGHGFGKPVSKMVNEEADVLAFVEYMLR